MKNIVKSLALVALLVAAVSCGSSKNSVPEIVVETMTMDFPSSQKIFVEELMPSEVIDTKITHKAFRGPETYTLAMPEDSVNMYVFVKGNATLVAGEKSFNVVPESIAIPIDYSEVDLIIGEGEVVHFVQFSKLITSDDKEQIKGFPLENLYDIYFAAFIDCDAYVEPIKSPNTVSRTVLHGDIVPRIALGTVQAPGPDVVGEHVHPMLDQLFLGLEGNNITVHADGASAVLPEFALLHIPLGSNHSVTVGEECTLYYLWMDFFMEKEGQEWLQTHNHVEDEE